ncbi:TPA: hypothetical protein ACG785_002940, partial [Enterococcus faecium]
TQNLLKKDNSSILKIELKKENNKSMKISKKAFLLVVLILLSTLYSVNFMRNAQEKSSPQSCVKVQPHQKHNVLRCEPNCHAFLSEERGQEQ